LQDFLESIIESSSVTTAFVHVAVPDVPFQAFEPLPYLLIFEQLGGDAVGDRGGLRGLQLPQFRRGMLRHRLVQWTAGHGPMGPTTTPVAPRAVQRIYCGNMLLAESDEAAQVALQRRQRAASGYGKRQ
jgi:hypothetical protein